MRVENRKPKIKQTVTVPRDFILYLSEVYREILEDEETATLESDDLLQYEEFDFAYGGLVNSETSEFGFTYFTDDENGSTWEITLSKSEIESIVKGETTKILLWACEHPLCGCKFSGENDSCFNCDWIEESAL